MTGQPPTLMTQPIPLLEPGDRLTRAEFERRYEAMPHLKKAELIEGVVYMPSPVRFERHGEPHAIVLGWLAIYRFATPGVRVADNATIRIDEDNEPQPDAMLIIDPTHGGRARLSEDDYIEGVPEMVVEVSSSSVSFDMNTKLDVYRRSGVKEYIVWRVIDVQIDWFVLRSGQFQPLAADTQGIVKSEVFPGLWLDTTALLNGDLAHVLVVGQQGIASPEHAQFVLKLQ